MKRVFVYEHLSGGAVDGEAAVELRADGAAMRDAVAAGTVSSRLSFFTLTPIGLMCAAAGLAYIVLATRWLLPKRGSPLRDGGDPRAYTIEMMVIADGPVAGRSIEEAGLRHLPGDHIFRRAQAGPVIVGQPQGQFDIEDV